MLGELPLPLLALVVGLCLCFFEFFMLAAAVVVFYLQRFVLLLQGRTTVLLIPVFDIVIFKFIGEYNNHIFKFYDFVLIVF